MSAAADNTQDRAPAPRAPRRGISVVVVLIGAAATVGYGIVGVGMSMGAPLVMLGLGGVALALCAIMLFRVVDPLLRPDGGQLTGPRSSVRLRELEREKQLVLKAIREIEHDFQMRKIAESDYQEMTQRYRGRAMRLMRELDAGDDYRALIEQELKTRLGAMEAAGTAGVVCAACKTGNDHDAQFCKKCGKALGAGA